VIRINLLPVRASQKKDRFRGQFVVLALSVVLTAAACAGAYVNVLGKVGDMKDEVSRKEMEISRLRKTIGEVGRFKKLQAELQGKLDVLQKLKEGKTGPVHLLDELSRVLPDKAWVTSFKESGGNVSLKGIGINEETVARFLRDLEASPYYRKVELGVVQQTGYAGLKLQGFDVTCQTEKPPKDAAVR